MMQRSRCQLFPRAWLSAYQHGAEVWSNATNLQAQSLHRRAAPDDLAVRAD
jgi:hypothetical protein